MARASRKANECESQDEDTEGHRKSERQPEIVRTRVDDHSRQADRRPDDAADDANEIVAILQSPFARSLTGR